MCNTFDNIYLCILNYIQLQKEDAIVRYIRAQRPYPLLLQTSGN